MLEGVEDVLTPAAKERTERFKAMRCLYCKGNVIPESTVEDAERIPEGEILPKALARCLECRCLFEPDTGIVVEKGNLANIFEADHSPIIKNS